MTYQTGAATDIDDLVDTVLKTFMTGRGWTVNDDNWPNHLHLSKGDCYVSLRRSPVTGDSSFNDAFSVARSNNALLAHLGSSYNGVPATPDLRYTGQPDSFVTTVGDADAVDVWDLTGPFTSYHLFSDNSAPDYIYLVVETAAGHYTNLFLGNLDKDTLTYTPGGGFLTGTKYAWWPNSTIYSSRDDVRFHDASHAFPFTNDGNMHVYSGNASPLQVMRSSASLMTLFNIQSSLATNLGAASSTGYWADGFFAAGPNPLNGVTPFLGIPIFQDLTTDSETNTFIGSLPNIRFCTMQGRFAGETITIGADNWIVFPMRHIHKDHVILEAEVDASPALNNTSGYYGFAVKKII